MKIKMGLEEQLEEGLIRKVSYANELRKYDKEPVLSQIFLKHYAENEICPSITITELEDRVEVFRYNLDFNLFRLFFSDLRPSFSEELGKQYRTIRFGTMPREKYYDLFRFLEQKEIWEINLHNSALDAGTNTLFISKGQRKHAFEIETIYRLIHLRKGNGYIVTKLLEGYSNSVIKDALRFLDIAKKIYSVSKRYAKTKI